MERLIKLQLYTAIEAGIAQRLAGAATRDIGRLKKDAPERYDRIREVATRETRKRLGRNTIGEIVAELYADFAPDVPEGARKSSTCLASPYAPLPASTSGAYALPS